MHKSSITTSGIIKCFVKLSRHSHIWQHMKHKKGNSMRGLLSEIVRASNNHWQEERKPVIDKPLEIRLKLTTERDKCSRELVACLKGY